MTLHGLTANGRIPLWAGAGLLLAAAAACSSAAGQPAAHSAAASHAPAVAIGAVSGVGKALVDAEGVTLYTNNRDTAAKLACTATCQVFWHPLTAAAGQQLASTPSLAAALSVRAGSSGQRQVTFHGKPLYTFSFDHHAGQAAGNGFSDMFGQTRFTWRAATLGVAGGTARPAAPAASTPRYPGY